MVYVLDKEKKYTRISKKPGQRDETFLLYEFTGNLNRDVIEQYLPKDSKILEFYCDNSGIIFTQHNNFEPKNILNIGRFACWQHQLKQQDVIKAAQFDYDIRNIWSRQGYFTSQMYDFNLFNTNIIEKEKLTQLFLLHLHSELTEILECTNYKTHKNKKNIDVEYLHSEIIDTFKYLLNICLIWNLTPDKFFEEFHKKSDIVEKRYEQEFKNAN